jgi:DNA helicase-2/ATP-dependent DNA helicase PcrA
LKELKADTTNEGVSRLQNIEELLNGIREFVDGQREEGVTETPTLADYLENVSLLTDADNDKPEDRNKVSLMTIHSAKGLEFNYVFLTGLEEELFPSKMSFSTPDEIEEERRLFYVGLTRAAVMATISYAQMRFKWGNVSSCIPSRFINEINSDFVEQPTGFEPNPDEEPSVTPSRNRTLNFGKPNFRPLQRAEARSNGGQLPGNSSTQSFNEGTVAAIGNLASGVKVIHERFGDGVIDSLEGSGQDAKAIIEFKSSGKKTLLLKYAKLRVVK